MQRVVLGVRILPSKTLDVRPLFYLKGRQWCWSRMLREHAPAACHRPPQWLHPSSAQWLQSGARVPCPAAPRTPAPGASSLPQLCDAAIRLIDHLIGLTDAE